MNQDSDDPPHPRCSDCGVPMWLAKIEKTPNGDNRHYECKACDATLVQRTAKS